MPTPEQHARELIDLQLAQAGWVVQDYKALNLLAGPGVAVREFPLKSGYADYLLYVDGKACGVIEAKPEGHSLTGVEIQSSTYTLGLPEQVPALSRPLPFAYESTGKETQFTSGFDPDPCSREVFTNPPFGKKSSIAIVTEEGELEKEDHAYERQDFWTTTKNKQLNFLQHVHTLLKVNGRCAIVVPDNVLFEGGAGETVRRNLLAQCDVHTLLRLPTGIFYAQGVKANVLFFDKRPAREAPWTERLWVYDLRTNRHFTLKTNPLVRGDLDEFVECYMPGRPRAERAESWGEDSPDGRWRSFTYDELAKRDKLNLDIFWLRDKSLEDSDDLPEPDVIAREIVDDLQTALEAFAALAEKLEG